MRFLRRWLRIERATIALHPARTLEISAPAAGVFGRCQSIIANDLGGHVTLSQPFSHIEASFGLVNSERLTIDVEAIDSARCRVTVQSRALARPDAVASSQYVEAFARLLTTAAR